ncbi:MAG TPA: hypothetical protein VMW87_04650 [Spirochaetia bacterium]|nr:hypothetical protein [Spirochaetia bacterium]
MISSDGVPDAGHGETGSESSENRLPSWFTEPGPDNDVVVSSRVRLARNLAGFSFPGFMTPQEESEVASGVVQLFQDRFSTREYLVVDPSRLARHSLQLLVERNLVSDDFPTAARTVLILRSDERFAASVNLVDHLRLSVLRGGRRVAEAFEEADRIDRIVEADLPYAVSLEWGYLNSEITNIGTGMRASVLLHLPALIETDQAPEVFETVTRSGFMVKGFWVSDGEESPRRSLGQMYQLANLITIGVRETDIVEKLDKAASQLVNYERKARRGLMRGRKHAIIEKRVADAKAKLLTGKSLSYREAVELLSEIRLGVALGLFPDAQLESVTALFFVSQRSHVLHALRADGNNDEVRPQGGTTELSEAEEVTEIEPETIDERRAALIRGYLYPHV